MHRIKKTFFSQLLFLTTILFTPTTQPLNIILDLGNVIFKSDSLTALQYVGYGTLARYFFTKPINLISPSHAIRQTWYTALYTIENTEEHSVTRAYDDNGVPLPILFCKKLTGAISGTQLMKTVNHSLQNELRDAYTIYEKEVIQSLTKLICDPTAFCTTQVLMEGAYEFVLTCKDNGHKLFILSNWDSESIGIMYEKYPIFFALFDGVVISGDIGIIKPDPEIYDYILNLYTLNPEETIFIDDQKANRLEALRHGMYSCFAQKPWSKTTDFDRLLKKIDRREQHHLNLFSTTSA